MNYDFFRFSVRVINVKNKKERYITELRTKQMQTADMDLWYIVKSEHCVNSDCE